jgi:hypothetical protein
MYVDNDAKKYGGLVFHILYPFMICYHTPHKSILELIAKSSHGKVSVLCKVLGNLTIFYESSMSFA